MCLHAPTLCDMADVPAMSSCQEEFPDAFRFSSPVFPSEDDHVVTSPYNATLAAAELINSAHCVLPLENQALAAISSRLENAATGKGAAARRSSPSATARSSSRPDSSSAEFTANLRGAGPSSQRTAVAGQAVGGRSQGGWEVMNGLAANLLLHLTSSMMFEGSLNTDLNDITMNLVRGLGSLGSGPPLLPGRLRIAANVARRHLDSVFDPLCSVRGLVQCGLAVLRCCQSAHVDGFSFQRKILGAGFMFGVKG